MSLNDFVMVFISLPAYVVFFHEAPCSCFGCLV
jgi:hypothetical protein